MTLSTKIVLVEPTDPKAVFDFALGLLGRAVDFEPRWSHTPAGGKGFSNAHYSSECGQGLPAWLWVHYADDAPLTYWDASDLEEDGREAPWWNEHCVSIDFDTAYGYRGPNGQGCSDLHAWLVQEVGRWLLDRGVEKWVWEQEFTGEWYGPHDDVRALGDPVRGALATGGTDTGGAS